MVLLSLNPRTPSNPLTDRNLAGVSGADALPLGVRTELNRVGDLVRAALEALYEVLVRWILQQSHHLACNVKKTHN